MLGTRFGEAIALRNRAAREMAEKAAAVEEPSPVATVARRSTIESAHKNATALVVAMEQRKQHWEEQLRIATEELRQAEVVLAGAYQLQHTIEQGMHAPAVVHDEVNLSSKGDDLVSPEELEKFLSGFPVSASA
jgi:hypothetical protein